MKVLLYSQTCMLLFPQTPKLAATLSLKPTFTRCASKLPGYHNTHVVFAQICVVVFDAVVEYGYAHTIAIVAHGVGG